jgi:hypothetical protein
VICTKMVEKEVDKPNQIGESQMSLVTIVVMSWVGKEWENIVDQFLVVMKTIQEWEIQQ